MKKLVNWVEKKFGPGETVKDLGVVHEERKGDEKISLSMRVCEKKGKLSLVLRHQSESAMGGGMSDIELPSQSLPILESKLAEARTFIDERGAS